uniref:isopentenyl-diphosphate Delta-isomerase n=1 Tax=Phlebotomus papatasi TaxID=29031 RepID=A0A1B0DJ20_PHLPP
MFRAKNLVCAFRAFSAQAAKIDAAKAKKFQEVAMHKEKCILVDNNGRSLGPISKYDCHRVVDGHVKAHRGFSVYLFNTQGQMLLQKRSKYKFTYPDLYTNTICSHPLYNIEEERDELNEIGVRLAAQRRLNYELGIPVHQIDPESFHYMTRIHYEHLGDETWGEHEIAYMFVLQGDFHLNPNPSEISEIRFITKEELDK